MTIYWSFFADESTYVTNTIVKLVFLIVVWWWIKKLAGHIIYKNNNWPIYMRICGLSLTILSNVQCGKGFLRSVMCMIIRSSSRKHVFHSGTFDPNFLQISTHFTTFGHCTEVRFASFLSGRFITAIVVNPSERKLAKRTSVHCKI